MRLVVIGICAVGCLANGSAAKAEAFTIIDAISQAVQTNPGVGEAAANRRATDAEFHQSQGTLLPQVRLDASGGPQRFNQQDIVPPPPGNAQWLPARSGSIVIRQTLFDGFASINEIWRQSARVDAAAHRVHERSELIALDAAEAYISVIRFTRLIAISQDNVSAHRRIMDNVQARFDGGRAGEGDLQQARERVAAAERYNEQRMRHARLQRDAFESLDKAWAARTITSDRAAALLRQVSADRKAIAAYNKEYELGQRSLIDLLNAENQLYNGLVSLESTRDVAVFADYQLLAAMGQLLMFLKTPESADALPLESIPLPVFQFMIPPILFKLPPTGSEPLNVHGAVVPAGSPNNVVPLSVRAEVVTFGDRWPQLASWPDTANVLAQLQQLAPHAAPGAPVAGEAGGAPALMSFAPEMLQVPPRPTSMNKPN